MKRTDGFDARRLRPRQPRSWGSRLASAFGMLLILAGILLAGSQRSAQGQPQYVVVDLALDS